MNRHQERWLSILASVTLCLVTASFGSAQTPASAPATDGSIPEEIAGEELTDLLDKWPDQYVRWIITDEEKTRYGALVDTEERLGFIETFWRRRDPTPGTAFNEFRTDYLERFAFVANRFSAGRPGWSTDRGRIYLTLGPPHAMQQNPTGRYGLERASEIWTYNNLDIPSLPASIDIQFVDFNGTGDFEIVSDIDATAPMWTQFGTSNNNLEAIAQRRGRLGEEDPRTGIARFRDVDGTRGIMREFDLQRQLQDIAGSSEANLRPWSDVVESSFTFRTLSATLAAGVVAADNEDGGAARIPVSITVPYRELAPEKEDDQFVYHLDYMVRLLDGNETERARIEDDLTLRVEETDYERVNAQRVGIEESLVAEVGDYRLQIFIRDQHEEKVGTAELNITVPERFKDALSLSTVFVAGALANAMPGANRPFQFGTVRVIPNATAAFDASQDLEIYLQAYGARFDEKNRKRLTIKCFVMKEGKLHLGYPASYLFPDTDPVGITAALPLRRLEAGEYRVLVRVSDQVSGQSATADAPFSVISSGKAER